MSRPMRSPTFTTSSSQSSQQYFASTMDVDGSQTSRESTEALPWQDTKILSNLTDHIGRPVNPEIHSKIGKGFFRADQDWTCYRRNYFAVACSYSLKLDGGEADPSMPCYVQGNRAPIERFAICIAACVNEDEERTVDLVQHTPKRDKGPTGPPKLTILKANQSGNLGASTIHSLPGIYGSAGPYYASQHGEHYTTNTIPSPPPPPADEQNTATFERIQFKKATANNGKRRAQQQYFHVRVELFAGWRKTTAAARSAAPGELEDEYEWQKIATRLSVHMVVRGRSPGHYTEGSQQSTTNMGGGPGVSGGSGGGMGSGLGGNVHPYGPGASQLHQRHYGVNGPFGGSYLSRNMLPIFTDPGLDLHSQQTACGGLEDSSMHDGEIMASQASIHHDHTSFNYYGPSTTQSMGLLSPTTSVTSPVIGHGTQRPQVYSSLPTKNGSHLHRQYGDEHGLIHRSSPSSTSPYGNQYETALRPLAIDHLPRWDQPAPSSHNRAKYESITPV